MKEQPRVSLDLPEMSDIPSAPAEGFAIGDALDPTTGETLAVLAVAAVGTWVSYTMPIPDAVRLRDSLDRWLTRHA
jgi:hypothetical protein